MRGDMVYLFSESSIYRSSHFCSKILLLVCKISRLEFRIKNSPNDVERCS